MNDNSSTEHAISVPDRYRAHPALHEGPFFTCPQPLLNSLCDAVGRNRFDQDLLQMEYDLSGLSGDHSSRIGFWRGAPIQFMLLFSDDNSVNSTIVAKFARMTNKSEFEIRRQLETLENRLEWTRNIRCGYCGWLMTNRQFLEEHRTLFGEWKNEIVEHGIPIMGTVVRDATAIPEAKQAEGRMEQFVREFEEFFIRWRLDGMPAPRVPVPMGVHLPVCDLRPVLGHMREGGKTFFFPDIFPVPSRDELRDAIENVLRQVGTTKHLEEWHEMVHSDNVAKIQISRCARLFRAQHHVRSLYARHGAALHRKKSALIDTLAEHLHVSKETIQKDFAYLAQRVGDNWHLTSV